MNNALVRLAAVLVLISSQTLSPAETTSTSFRFGFVSDSHVITTDALMKDYGRTVGLRSALADLAQLGVEFVIHGGDAVETPGNASQMEVLASIVSSTSHAMKIVFIPGNHDVDKPTKPELAARWCEARSSPATHYGFLHQNAAFYVLNTQDFDASGTLMSTAKEQIAAMDKFFAGNSLVGIKIVCGHAPPFLKQPDEPDEYFNIPQFHREPLLAAMKKHHVRYYLSGHLHRDVTTTGIPAVFAQTALSFQLDKNGKSGYYVFSVTGDEMSRKFIRLID